MRSWIFSLALSSLFGVEVLMVPNFQADASFLDYPSDVSFHSLTSWQKFRFLLEKHGSSLTISKLDFLPHKPKEIRKYFEGHPDQKVLVIDYNFKVFTRLLPHIPKENLLFFIFEPPSVFPYLHTKECYKKFSKVFTWDDAKVNGRDVFKYNYCYLSPMRCNLPPFHERKLACLIAGNKYSDYPFELYSERRRAIAFFENNHPEDFAFYGAPGWEKEKFSTYLGPVDDKIKAMGLYKFAICYENTHHILGYITEKIFDCFQAGIVPVYLGADNICDYIPANCFIDKRCFASYEELYNYLSHMTESEFETYLENIRIYLATDQARAFSTDAFALSLANGILGTNMTLADLDALP